MPKNLQAIKAITKEAMLRSYESEQKLYSKDAKVIPDKYKYNIRDLNNGVVLSIEKESGFHPSGWLQHCENYYSSYDEAIKALQEHRSQLVQEKLEHFQLINPLWNEELLKEQYEIQKQKINKTYVTINTGSNTGT